MKRKMLWDVVLVLVVTFGGGGPVCAQMPPYEAFGEGVPFDPGYAYPQGQPWPGYGPGAGTRPGFMDWLASHPWLNQPGGGFVGGPLTGVPVYVPEQGAVVLDPRDACAPPRAANCAYRDPPWAHRTSIFAEALYLRPRDAEVVYAAPVDGAVPLPPGNQFGRLGVVDPDYNPAFRVGFWWARDCWTSMGASYTRFESQTSDHIEAEPPDFVLSLVTHPGVNNADNNWQVAGARLDVDFDLIDVNYRWVLANADDYVVNLVAGARFGNLTEDFRAVFAINGSRAITSEVSFDGAGIRLGAEAQRYAPCSGCFVYGRSDASLLAGEFRASYTSDSDLFGGGTEIATHWKAGRVLPILELELGVGWRSRQDRLRLRAGYLFAAWLNTVRTDDWIHAVQTNNFVALGGDNLTFDGLVANAEWRF